MYKKNPFKKENLCLKVGCFFHTHHNTSAIDTDILKQWRKSVKIIGGDETEPSKVAHIISRKPLKYIRYFSPKTGCLQKKKKKVFIEIESHSSAKIGKSDVLSAKN